MSLLAEKFRHLFYHFSHLSLFDPWWRHLHPDAGIQFQSTIIFENGHAPWEEAFPARTGEVTSHKKKPSQRLMKVKLREFAKPLCESGYLNLYVYVHPENWGRLYNHIITHFDGCIVFKGVGSFNHQLVIETDGHDHWGLRWNGRKRGQGWTWKLPRPSLWNSVKLQWDEVVHPGWAGSNLETQTTIYKWMFGETTIFYTKIWNHPIETTIYKWLFGVPGVIHGVILLMKKTGVYQSRLVIYPVIYTGFYTSLLVQDFCSINSMYYPYK